MPVTHEAFLLNAVVLALDDGVLVVAPDGELLLKNPAAERLVPGGVGWLTGDRRAHGGQVQLAEGGYWIPLEELPAPRAWRGKRTEGLEVIPPPGGAGPSYLGLSGRPLTDEDGTVSAAVVVVRDVTAALMERKTADEIEERFRLTFQNAPVGMAIVAVEDEGGTLLQVNGALAKLAGRPAEELVGLDLGDLIATDDTHRERTLRGRLLSPGDMRGREQELRFQGSDGTIWVRASSSVARGAPGRPRYAVVQFRDVSQSKRFEERLQHLADHDPLTGLRNRRRLQEALVAHQRFCKRFDATGSLLLLDLDGFKDVNDTLGHLVGDQVLRNVGAVLSERLRETDVVARLGGDEFAMLLPRTSVDAAVGVARELIREVQDRSGAGVEWSVHVTASVGIAGFTGGDVAERDVLAEADVALYEAKQNGRGQVASYAPRGQQERIATRLTWATRIREALESGTFELAGQPIFDFRENRVTQHELLLRLPLEDGPLATAAEFLPVAEQFGSIRAVDSWVIRAAAALLESRTDLGLLHVNVSTASLADPGFGAELSEVIARSRVHPSRLTLEITETAAISHMDRASTLAASARAAGHGLALDDFGAGFASFYYLKHLPADLLKIDGEFVKDLTTSELSRTVVQAIVQVARSLGRQTVAECVEDAQTFELLREMGVDAAQGWYVGRPEPLPPKTG